MNKILRMLLLFGCIVLFFILIMFFILHEIKMHNLTTFCNFNGYDRFDSESKIYFCTNEHYAGETIHPGRRTVIYTNGTWRFA